MLTRMQDLRLLSCHFLRMVLYAQAMRYIIFVISISCKFCSLSHNPSSDPGNIKIQTYMIFMLKALGSVVFSTFQGYNFLWRPIVGEQRDCPWEIGNENLHRILFFFLLKLKYVSNPCGSLNMKSRPCT